MAIGVPTSTYRLQFNHLFTFKDAQELVPYLSALGIDHVYASPIFHARKGSLHGYDIVDHSQLNQELGSLEDFLSLARTLQEHHMGLILDIVPNHMAIGMENPWWMDVLENGPSSIFASYFDIDWHPTRIAFNNKITLPILEQLFGIALEQRLIQLCFEQGCFNVKYGQNLLPVATESLLSLLEPLLNEISKLFSEEENCLIELNYIVSNLREFSSLKSNERQLAKKKLNEWIAIFFEKNPNVLTIFLSQLEVFNGIKGNPHSFDLLEQFLDKQYYRLCYWRVANEEVNYRRFFDIFEYASIRIEKAEVFHAVHKKVFELIKMGCVNGLRIDHIDGLLDPQQYLENLHKYSPTPIPYIIVEKILTGNEQLSFEWPVQGSVGYDFLNQLNGLFVVQENGKKFLAIYQNFTKKFDKSGELKYECKKMLLNTSLASELNQLNRKLNYLAENQRDFQDFTSESLKKALIEIIAFFPVYRTYIQPKNSHINIKDRKIIQVAVEKAKRKNRGLDPSIFDFIRGMLLLHNNESIDKKLQKKLDVFVTSFQQFTGPVMAKGLEDTAFFRFFPLSSLNEVGGDPSSFGISLNNFFKKNILRKEKWPWAMLSSTTHDTKRSEDVRVRINVLSEIPEEWERILGEWSVINTSYKTKINGQVVPDRNEEYLIYQTLIGTWPLGALSAEGIEKYVVRMGEFFEKAIKEGKIHSSWIDANEPYHQAVRSFLKRILEFKKENVFLNSLVSFVDRIREAAMLNSLSQVIIKCTSPGVADIYQGNELWNFSLVDPDNRRMIDYSIQKELQARMTEKGNVIQSYIDNPESGEIKLYVTQKTLQLRKQSPQLFLEGDYFSLQVEGQLAEHVIAFSLFFKNQILIVLTSRFQMSLKHSFAADDNKNQWKNTFLIIPEEFSRKKYVDLYTGKELFMQDEKISLEVLFDPLPFSLLYTS